ncbi:MAG: alpha/beta fold hydrolase [Proteobacteria bacterium]|nr:alpha/beta fold hydrolase [Pseudomonadota bacterium]
MPGERTHFEQLTVTVHGERSADITVEQVRIDGDSPLMVERVRCDVPRRGTVLLVHGLAQNRFTWRVSGRSLTAFLAEAGYEVLNVELRGHGRSRAAGAGNARAFGEYVEDVVRVVEALDEPPFAIGHSLGAGVLVAAATQVELRGLVHLAGVFAFAQHNRTLRGLARLSLGLEGLLTLAPVRASTGWAGEVIGAAYKLTDLAGYLLPLAGWVPGSIERDVLEERLARGFDWTSIEVWLQMSRWARGERFEYADAFGTLDVPLLVIAGDHDALLPPGDARVCFEQSGSSDKQFYEANLFDHGAHFGHLDLILGREAPRVVWEPIRAWMQAR